MHANSVPSDRVAVQYNKFGRITNQNYKLELISASNILNQNKSEYVFVPEIRETENIQINEPHIQELKAKQENRADE